MLYITKELEWFQENCYFDEHKNKFFKNREEFEENKMTFGEIGGVAVKFIKNKQTIDVSDNYLSKYEWALIPLDPLNPEHSIYLI